MQNLPPTNYQGPSVNWAPVAPPTPDRSMSKDDDTAKLIVDNVNPVIKMPLAFGGPACLPLSPTSPPSYDPQVKPTTAVGCLAPQPVSLTEARKVFRNRAISLLYADALKAFDAVYHASRRTAAAPEDYMDEYSDHNGNNDSLNSAMEDAVRTSMSQIGFLACLAAGTSAIWQHGTLPWPVHEMLYRVSPSAYRKMVECILGIRGELEGEGEDVIAWDVEKCELRDEVPKAFRTDYYEYVIAMPALRLYECVVKGRAVAVNAPTEKRKRDQRGARAADPGEKMWRQFLEDLV